MPQPEQKILPTNSQSVRLVSGKAFEEFVDAIFPNKMWKFPFQSSPIFVPGANVKPCQTCEAAIETWVSGINGRHYHVSAVTLVRHFSAKGLIAAGNYLLISDPKSYGERLSGGFPDESTVEGPKGVF